MTGKSFKHCLVFSSAITTSRKCCPQKVIIFLGEFSYIETLKMYDFFFFLINKNYFVVIAGNYGFGWEEARTRE